MFVAAAACDPHTKKITKTFGGALDFGEGRAKSGKMREQKRAQSGNYVLVSATETHPRFAQCRQRTILRNALGAFTAHGN